MAAPVEAVSGVLLDAGGVFMLPSPEPLRATLRSFGCDPDPATLARAHYRATAAMDAIGGKNWDVYNRAYATVCGVPAGALDGVPAALEPHFTGGDWTEPIPESVDTLRRLVAARVPVGIVSNSNGMVADLLLGAAVCQVGDGAATPVACVVDSHLVGVAKPDPRIFDYGLDALGLPPEKVLYVGDTARADVDGARAAGIRPIHLDPYQDCPDPAGDHEHVRRLDEILAMV